MYDPIRYLNMLNASSTMIEVFKTNVQGKRVAKMIIMDLAQLLPNAKINFDLEDCDNILRIECHHLIVGDVIEIVKLNGFSCEVLE